MLTHRITYNVCKFKKSHTFRHNKCTSQQYSFKTSLVNLKKNGMMIMCFHCDYWKGGGQTRTSSITSSRFIHRKLHKIGQKTERATPIIASMQLHPTLHCPVLQTPAPPQQYRKKGLLNPRGYVRRAEITTNTKRKSKLVNNICLCAFFRIFVYSKIHVQETIFQETLFHNILLINSNKTVK